MVTALYRFLFGVGNETTRVTALNRFLFGVGNETTRVTAFLQFMQCGRTTGARVTVL